MKTVIIILIGAVVTVAALSAGLLLWSRYSAPEITLSWQFTPTPASTAELPESLVSLVINNGKSQEIINVTTASNCEVTMDDDVTQAYSDALLTTYCWWAGYGEDFAVVRTTPDTLTIRHRERDEETYGEIIDLQHINIPENAVVK